MMWLTQVTMVLVMLLKWSPHTGGSGSQCKELFLIFFFNFNANAQGNVAHFPLLFGKGKPKNDKGFKGRVWLTWEARRQ